MEYDYDDDDQELLPLLEAEPAGMGGPPLPPEITLDVQGRRTVLVVSDNEALCKRIQMGLQKEPLRVVTVVGDRSILMSTILKEPPALILFDGVFLRTTEGHDCWRLIRQHKQLSSIPMIVLLNANPRVFDTMRNRLLGAKGYLTVPFEDLKLVVCIRNALK
jgi:DNA-binding response OmpR family regulator